MQFRDLDRSTPEGQKLLARLAARHGEPLAEAARALERLFLLGSDLAPGLCFVGGRTSQAPLGPSGVFSVAGAAETLEDALASVAGEAIERMALVERSGDVRRRSELGAARLRHDVSHLARLFAEPETQVDLVLGRDPLTNQRISVPADWCLRRAQAGPLRIPATALSTGAAAGRDFDDAAARALLELVERDAAALWWYAGRPARAIAPDEPAIASAIGLLATYRRDATQRQTRLFDITTDIGIPVVVAASTNDHGRSFACGLACRLSRAAAARAAVTELCQSEIGMRFAEEKRAQLGDAALSDTDRGHFARATRVDLERMPFYAAPLLGDPELPHAMSRSAAIATQLAVRKTSVMLVDLSRGPVSVVKAVCPGLHLYPGNVHLPHLLRTRREFGGATHWTDGCTLM